MTTIASHRLAEGRALLASLDLPSTNDQARKILNPANEEVLAGVPDGSAGDVDRAVESAAAAFATWGRVPPSERAALLLALAAVVEGNARGLGELESLNTGKPVGVAVDEMALAADSLRFFAGAARTSQAPAPARYTRSHTSLVVREPIGVTAGIAPWNYPFLTAVWKLAPALAGGNCVIVKPSELTPLSLLAFLRLAADVLPPGVLAAVPGTGAAVGAALSRHPGIGLVSLTGSVAAGRAVSAAAAATLKRVHLELGGKAPVLVFADAELPTAIDTIATMGFWNAGQECGAATRVLVHSSVHDAVVEGLVEAAGAVALGDPSVEDGTMGPLISAAHRERVDAMVRGAERDGATLRHGGRAADRPGWFYEPTILDGVRAGTDADRVEIFGPVITVGSFESDAEALAAANDTEYGLSASVWTRDVARALRMCHDLDAGTVWVNDHLALATEMPWGGFKSSGTGRDLSTLSLEEYTRTKHVMIQTASEEQA